MIVIPGRAQLEVGTHCALRMGFDARYAAAKAGTLLV